MNENTDPNAIARELLKIDTSAIGGSMIVDGVDVLETVRAAQKIARAVERVDALADQLDREASEYLGRPVHSQAGDLIRAALNGETA